MGHISVEYQGVDCSFNDNGGYFTQGLCKPQLTFYSHDQPIVMNMWASTGNENDEDNLCHFEVFDDYWTSWKYVILLL